MRNKAVIYYGKNVAEDKYIRYYKENWLRDHKKHYIYALIIS
jgi:hypothetical protein